MLIILLAVRAKGWIESIRFYTKFVLNWDEHKISGVTRWLRRVFDYVQDVRESGRVIPILTTKFDGEAYFSKSADELRNMDEKDQRYMTPLGSPSLQVRSHIVQ